MPPPRDEETLRAWARQLGLKPGSDDWCKLSDYAAVDAGRMPDYVLKDEELVQKLPAFFRTLSGSKPSDEELHGDLHRGLRHANVEAWKQFIPAGPVPTRFLTMNGTTASATA